MAEAHPALDVRSRAQRFSRHAVYAQSQLAVPGAYDDRTALSPAAPIATEDRTVRRLCEVADRLVAKAA
ncbi:hypothetical protein [Streptomyces rhizosphaericus]|uniref:hypothetical protein n=1 Tax=Streptomyces rhizosphaericus TaxID=114699 RepID=UPI00202ED32B|nr:hypothetical protein [Streptomyces rhizosphaericus]